MLGGFAKLIQINSILGFEHKKTSYLKHQHLVFFFSLYKYTLTEYIFSSLCTMMLILFKCVQCVSFKNKSVINGLCGEYADVNLSTTVV